MKISSNYAYKPTFGYDKNLCKQLREKLDNYPDKNWAATLITLNAECNAVESVLKAEEEKKNISRLEDYTDIFSTLKQVLTGYVSLTFDELNFADREFIHYYDEFVKSGSKKDDWRIEACEALKDWVSPSLFSKFKKNNDDNAKQIFVPKFDEDGVEIGKPPIQKPQQPSQKVQDIVEKVKSELSPKSFLEEYVPTLNSPRGFGDVAGMDELKRDLSEGIIQLIQNPQQAKLDFEDYGKEIPKGILLYGPPGCGKTYITQALSQEIQTPLYLLNISKAGSHYINMTSKNIAAAFDEAISIADKTGKPCLVFMDEIDTMCFDRNSRMEPDDLKQVGTILQAIDKAKSHNVIIIGATNKYNLLDPAVKRRFDSKVFVGLPDTDSVASLLQKNLSQLKKGQKLLSDGEKIQKVSKMLNGYSNSSICNISKEAALSALRRDRADIDVEDYENAIKKTGEEKPNIKEYLSDSKREVKKIGF